MKVLYVLGFKDVERHAINSMVRLSVERNPSYTIWLEGMGTPDIVLIDSQHIDAYKVCAQQAVKSHVIWVGNAPPMGVIYRVARPMQWMEVLRMMDQIVLQASPTQPFGVSLPSDAGPSTVPANLDFDVTSPSGYASTSGYGSSQPSLFYIHADNTLGKAPDKRKRVLIVDDSPHFRMYLKAVLSVNGEMVADECADADEAIDMAGKTAYDSILIDVDLNRGTGLALCKKLAKSTMVMRPGDTRISRPNLFMMAHKTSLLQKFKARNAGAQALLLRPRNQAQLDVLFAALNRYAMG